VTTFNVTTASTQIQIGMDHQARAQFTATNSGSRLIRGVAHVMPLGRADAAWFEIEGDVQRQFAPGTSQEFDVRIQIPPDTPAGAHQLRLDVIGVELPDEDFGQSPEVTFVIGAPPPVVTSKGYLVTMIGAAAGGLIGVIVGTLPGTLAFIAFEHQAISTTPGVSIVQAFLQAFFEVLFVAILIGIVVLLAIVVGVWIGPVLGALVALRVRAQSSIGLTVGLLAVFQPIVTVLLVLAAVAITNAIKGNGPAIATLVVAGLIDLTLPALLARAAARLIRVRRL